MPQLATTVNWQQKQPQNQFAAITESQNNGSGGGTGGGSDTTSTAN
jgi:hypothetical protein